MGEPLLPMINVVFLLLIFFLIVARMAVPAPIKVTPPEAQGGAVEGEFRLFLSATGELAFAPPAQAALRGDAALVALGAARAAYCATAECGATAPALLVLADAQVSGAALASLLPRLAALGFAEAHLLTVAP